MFRCSMSNLCHQQYKYRILLCDVYISSHIFASSARHIRLQPASSVVHIVSGDYCVTISFTLVNTGIRTQDCFSVLGLLTPDCSSVLGL